MSAEKPSLTPEQVAHAESRIGVSHPVLSVIDEQLPAISQLRVDFSKREDRDLQEFIRETHGFLADAVVEAGPFAMEPTDIISIWSRATEVFSLYQRYTLAAITGSAYAIQGLEDPAWKQFPRRVVEHRLAERLPEELKGRKADFAYVHERLEHVLQNIHTISGLDRALMEEGNRNHLLGEVIENFGNGFVPLFWSIED